ncbi:MULTISPECIES: winged helix-turn-helix domain-containing protein [Mesorhizobium]|uniref:nSTAND1 domain-containing NTPase n=1 Tax=Mesorhizobium TaxID=68287 RepID=UPI00131A3F6A|nr:MULTISPECIES: winged helix-turn-helix domain-containing protein [Mesorhizobium]MBE1706491.1 winged helix-turn-helix domain-containing protein [Mesorhizobium japonicum]MBE1714998.1 winged helix-turn-helix domain-containing protein [Mesorhizobium japonicum]
MNSSRPTTFVLNGVTADLSSETLRDKSNRTIALRHQAFAVLRHLLENADRVITKDDLMNAVWNGIAVTDDSLVQCIHEIRSALNDDRQTVVQTVPRRGYRLVLPSNAGPKMATILAAEMAAEGRPTGRDEWISAATFPAYRQIIDRLLVQHAGRGFWNSEVSVVAEFTGPVEAMRCASEIQHEVDRRNFDVPETKRLRFRIGVHLGYVVAEGDHIAGEAVEVVAHLQTLSRPGGICVTEAVHAQAQDRLSLEFLDLGEHNLKNVARALRIYRVPLASEQPVRSPFRGLDAFEFEDADLFFGRARAIAACTARLEQQAASGKAFLLIYGMSGCGKSSLLRAGLLPSLTRPGAVAGISLWRRCLIRLSEGPDAFAVLAAALLREGAVPELACEVTAAEFALLCRSAPDRALAMVRQALGKAAGPARPQIRLLVAIDQLEELFTTEREPATREALVRLMAGLAASGLIWVIAAIRSDFFHRCGEVPGFSALKDGLSSYELLPPTGPEIAQIIREPAAVAGLRFEESAELGRLDDVLQEAAAADPGSLPLLEFVLDALYQAGRDSRVLTFAHYRALGGLEGAIARRADEVLDLLAPEIQEALPAVLRALTTANLGDETVTARAALYTEVAGTPARSALVRALIDARLLVSDEDAAGHVFVRLAHEALLSRWPRAGDIVNANRNFLATRERLRADAHRWHLESRNRELLLPSGKRLAEGEELMLSRREEVDDAVLEYIEESLRAHRQKEEKDRHAELALIEAAEEAKRERLEREAERRSLAAAAANRLARRTRNAAFVAIMLALMAGAGALVAFKAREEARGQRDQALRNQFLSLSFLSERSAAAGNTEAAIRLALEALPSKEQPERPYLFEAEAALYKALLAHRQIKILRPGAGVAHAAFNPTGDRIVTASYDRTAAVWDISSGAETAILKGHDGAVERAEFSPDGSRILTAARDGTARLWDAVSGEQLYILRPVGNYPTAIFSPDGTRVLTAGENSDATLWDARTGKKVLGVSSDAYTRAAFSSDGRSFATAGKHFVSIWNTADGALTRSIRVTSWPYTLAFSPDGSRMVAGPWGWHSHRDTSSLFDLSKGAEIAKLAGSKSDTQLNGVIFSHGGQRIATISLDGTARIWDGSLGTPDDVLGQEVSGLKPDIDTDERDVEMNGAFTPDDRFLATASINGPIRVWDVERASLVTTIAGHESLVEHLEFSPVDSNILLTASHDGTARLWDVDGALTTALPHEYRPIFAVFSPDNVHLLTGGGDSAAHLWDVVSGREIIRLDTHEIIQSASFSPDGRRVATASLEGVVRIFDVATGHETAQFRSDAGLIKIQFGRDGKSLVCAWINGAAQLWDATTGAELAVIHTSSNLPQAILSPDGRRILSAREDNAGHLLTTSGAELRALVGHQDRITAGAFNPDGQLVATGSLDHTARIWSTTEGTSVRTLEGHTGAVTAVAFSPDSQSLLTASRDGTARIWSVAGGPERVLRGHSGALDSAEFSPNGLYVVTASSEDRTVRLWATQSGRQIAVLASQDEATVRPSLTRAAFSSDGTRVAIISGEERVRIVRVFQTPNDLIDFARRTVPRELTPCERRSFFLPADPATGICPS